MSQPSAPDYTQTEQPTRQARFDLSEMRPWREFAVILFNDDVHSMDEVEVQLMRALACPLALAQALTARVHHHGRATVAIVQRDRALQIAVILRQINLRVALRQVN